MPKVSVVFEDNVIVVGGVPVVVRDMPAHDTNWRALQWDGSRGHIEKHGAARQEFFDDPKGVQTFIDAHNQAVKNQTLQAAVAWTPPDPKLVPHSHPVTPPIASPQPRPFPAHQGGPITITGTKQL